MSLGFPKDGFRPRLYLERKRTVPIPMRSEQVVTHPPVTERVNLHLPAKRVLKDSQLVPGNGGPIVGTRALQWDGEECLCGTGRGIGRKHSSE